MGDGVIGGDVGLAFSISTNFKPVCEILLLLDISSFLWY